MKKIKMIILSFAIISCLVTVQVEQVYADAGSIAVAGGAIGVAGVGLAGITGPVVIAVFLGLMAFGMNVSLTEASQEAGMTKTQFVKSKLDQYCEEAGIAKSTFANYVLQEAEVYNDGRIKLTDKACEMIKRFGNWLFQEDMVYNPPATGAGGLINAGLTNLLSIQTGSHVFLGYNSNNQPMYVDFDNVSYPTGICVARFNNSYTLLVISKTSYSGMRIKTVIGESGGSQFNNYNLTSRVNNADLYYVMYNYIYNNLITLGGSIPFYDGAYTDLLNGLDGTFENIDGADTVADDTFTGSRDDWASGNPALDPTADKSTVVNPDLINSVPVPADTDLTWDVRSYLDAIEKALDKVANPDATAVDDATGLPVSIPIPDTVALDPSIEKVNDTDLPDTGTPIIDPDKAPDNPEQEIDPLTFDLRNIFPFCLPWDFKDMVNLLSADPVAPQYHVKWYVPFAKEYIEFDVDLSGYNNVAAIMRNMELLVFCIGLAIVTRNYFIRG